MDAIRPTKMLEFGVASGFSSANIIHFASKFGLLQSNKIYLTSFDLDDDSLSGKNVGSFVSANFPEYLPFWKFYPGRTSLDLCIDPAIYLPSKDSENERILTFIDAGHNHPWPGVDLISLYRVFQRTNTINSNSDNWVMLQDVRMMERWIMDCVRFNVASPAPVRGVEHAFSLWPGKKFSGINICFNMAAINLNISSDSLISYYKELLSYDFECSLSRSAIEDALFHGCEI